MLHLLASISIRGTSSPSEESSSAEKSDLELDDSASLFGLVKRDLARPSGAVRLDDLSCRQLGFVVSNVLEAVTPSDVFPLGGELAPRLNSLLCFHSHARGVMLGFMFLKCCWAPLSYACLGRAPARSCCHCETQQAER